LTDGDNTAILIVTPVRLSSLAAPKAVYVDYNSTSGRWRINHVDLSPMSAGEYFNVMIVKS
jgi:hypothetical protein